MAAFKLDLILHDFLVESQENLQRLDQYLVTLEEKPGNQELIADVFRTIHSIKGSAGFLTLPQLETLAHWTEEVLAKARSGTLQLTSQQMTCVLHAIDSLRAILNTLEQTGKEGRHDFRNIIADLQQISEGESSLLDSESPGQSAPPVQSAESVDEPPVPLDAIPRLPQPSSSQETMPEINEPRQHAESHLENTRVHVNVEVLDHLMNLTGELVLTRNQVVRKANDAHDPGWQAIAQQMDSIVVDLQETMLKARMQEIREVFGMFPRLVRDLSKQHGKDVQLRMEGQKTELDRTLIETLKEPLVHLIRNAIDHGIEPSDARRQQGKPATGTITIRAYQEKGQVRIDMSDDGRGIDLERVKEQAIASGLLSPQQAAEMNAQALLELIFRPGFSTAKTVTNISGRGVGMDVVKQHINQIGGVVEITTAQGVGTTFHLRLPMTLAIISGLLISTQNRHFVIPQQHLEELVRFEQIDAARDIQRIAGAEVFRLRDELLPLIRLTTILQLPSQEADLTASPHIIILSTGERRFGLFVDHVSDTEEIVVKPLGRHIKQQACYDGATILGNGNVALILNVRALFAAARFKIDEFQRAEYLEAHATPSPQTPSDTEQRQTIVLFTAGANEYYGVPLAFVERIETFETSRIRTSGGYDILQYRNEALPLMRLEPLLHLAQPPEKPVLSLLVFTVEKEIGLIAQTVINTVEINTQIDTKRFRQKGVLGSTMIDGKAVLILDVHGLIELAYPAWYQQLLASKLSEAERRRIRVLLVEDSKFFLNIEQSYLNSAGYQVITADHGNEALDILKQQMVDVVITDIEMPYCNGYELTKAIKSNAAWQHLPVMAVTALSGEEDRQKGMAAGIDEYRIKLDRDEVLQALEQLILRARKRGEIG